MARCHARVRPLLKYLAVFSSFEWPSYSLDLVACFITARSRTVCRSGDAELASYCAHMAMHPAADHAPADFLEAISTLRGLTFRPELTISEIPAPAKLAPFSLALTAEIHSDDTELGDGRFVVLYDPKRELEWGGKLRIVALLRAEVEPDIGEDTLLSEVAWTWLTEALNETHADWTSLGGTTTVVSSRSHGEIDERDSSVDLQIRASWTATGSNLSRHLDAWSSTLCLAAGLVPSSETVIPLRQTARSW